MQALWRNNPRIRLPRKHRNCISPLECPRKRPARCSYSANRQKDGDILLQCMFTSSVDLTNSSPDIALTYLTFFDRTRKREATQQDFLAPLSCRRRSIVRPIKDLTGLRILVAAPPTPPQARYGHKPISTRGQICPHQNSPQRVQPLCSLYLHVSQTASAVRTLPLATPRLPRRRFRLLGRCNVPQRRNESDGGRFLCRHPVKT